MYFYIFRVIITHYMQKIFRIKEKLYGAYDTVSSRTNCYHNGGSTSEGLSTDLEYTLGLDNRGEINNVIGLITTACIFACVCYVLVAGVNTIMAIPCFPYSIIGLFVLLLVISKCILPNNGQ